MCSESRDGGRDKIIVSGCNLTDIHLFVERSFLGAKLQPGGGFPVLYTIGLPCRPLAGYEFVTTPEYGPGSPFHILLMDAAMSGRMENDSV